MKSYNQIINDLLENASERKNFDSVLELSQIVADRNLYLGDIEEGTGDVIDTSIRFWNRVDDEENIPVEERKPIKLYINSCGGSLLATFTIIDAIKMSKTPVWTIAVGSAYSGGFFSFICGHRRFAYPNASFLYHEGSAGTSGTASQFANFAAFYKKQLEKLKQIVLTNTTMGEEKFNEIQKDDFWMTAEEAVSFGCADEIITELV
jgi:ATP-dependent Clp protease protease subunit